MLARLRQCFPATLTPRECALVFALAWGSVIVAAALAAYLHRRHLQERANG